jgi:hypothetical protein
MLEHDSWGCGGCKKCEFRHERGVPFPTPRVGTEVRDLLFAGTEMLLLVRADEPPVLCDAQHVGARYDEHDMPEWTDALLLARSEPEPACLPCFGATVLP